MFFRKHKSKRSVKSKRNKVEPHLSHFKEALKSEKALLIFYNKYYENNLKTHNELYNTHLENLNNIDKSIPNMKSMKKLFLSQCPNEIKPKKFNKKKLDTFFKNDILFLHSYNTSKLEPKLEFLKHHIKVQIYNVIHKYFDNMMDNIRNYQIFFVNEPSEKSQKSLKNMRFNSVSYKSKKKEPIYIDYRNAKTLRVKLNKNILIEVIFVFNNGREVVKTVEHTGFALDKKETFNVLKDVIMESNVKSTKKSLDELFKEQEEKIDKIILKEKNEEILVRLMNKVDEGEDSKQLLEQLKMDVKQNKSRKSRKSSRSRKSTSNKPMLRFTSNNNNNNNKQLNLNYQVKKELEDDPMKPPDNYKPSSDPFEDESSDIDEELRNIFKKQIQPTASRKSKKSKSKR
jgi:hypothetical protein